MKRCILMVTRVSPSPMASAASLKVGIILFAASLLRARPETHFPPLRRLLGSSGSGCFDRLSGSETLQFSFWTGQPEGLSGVSGQTVSDNGASSIAGDLAEYSSSALRPGQREPS
jgi:hypothetical protein